MGQIAWFVDPHRGTEIYNDAAAKASEERLANIPCDGKPYPDPTNPLGFVVKCPLHVPPPYIKGVPFLCAHSHCGSLGDGTVLKYPQEYDELSGELLAFEGDVLAALGPHERIVELIRRDERGLILRLAENHCMIDYLPDHPTVPVAQRLQWCVQTAEAVAYVHSRGVMLCNLSPWSVLLDEDLGVKLTGFGISRWNGKGPRYSGNTRYALPATGTDAERRMNPVTVAADLFAMGGTFFYIMRGRVPFEDVGQREDQGAELRRRYRAGEFPDVTDIVGGDIIMRCWRLEYPNADAVVHDLMALLTL